MIEPVFQMRFEGRCWKFGDNIPTDRLVKTQYVLQPMEEIVKHVLEDLNPDFPRQVKPGDIVVAGKHFGQSSGRAIAPKAMKATGIGCVVADTFSRTFYRNCFEVGLPAFELDGVTALVSEGDTIAIDLEHGLFSNVTTGVTRLGVPADPFLLDMLAAGGLIKMVAARPEWLGA